MEGQPAGVGEAPSRSVRTESECVLEKSGVVRDGAAGKEHGRSGETSASRLREPVLAVRYEKSRRVATRLKLPTVGGEAPTSTWTPKERETEEPEVWWGRGVRAFIVAS